MALTASLLIGQTALSASQVAIQVAGNNIANVATPGYSRQRVGLTTHSSQYLGHNSFIGRGVRIESIKRIVDPALINRSRAASATQTAAGIDANILSSLESITNELTGYDLSTQLTSFFNAFSDLANTPTQMGTRTLAVEQGVTIAQYLRELRSELVSQRQMIENQLYQHVSTASGLLDQVAALNHAIISSEGGSDGENGNLRDQRDAVLDQLAELMDITVVDAGGGSVDVLVDSIPVVVGAQSRGLEFHVEQINGKLNARVATVNPQEETIRIRSGAIGALLNQRETALVGTIEQVDRVTANLIFEVNRIHAMGAPEGGLTSAIASVPVIAANQSLSFNNPANTTFAGMDFLPQNGSFQVTIADGNGYTQTHTIPVKLTGINNAGVTGYEDDASLESIAAALNAIPHLNATITVEGKLSITTAEGFNAAFSDDTSNLLPILGVNAYFTGENAIDIAVRQDLRDDPSKLAVGYKGANDVALAIAQLRDKPLSSMGGNSIIDSWLGTTQSIAVESAGAQTRYESLSAVRSSLEAQRQSISGVSMDEESINLITYQNQYQGAARFISIVNELTTTLLSLV